ncbi:DinB family protein [Paenibacillus sp.]|uniref:DinB family protein n=1 Tax=Paenibacillus sp. TaxID=58172 RepID=UPI002D39F032|nr:DinB family protein [Paenibacillus sp.]HZG56641.1 DinB family protein [Paenibacillus sp.]
MNIAKPVDGDYNPYFKTYIDLVEDGDIVAALETQAGEMRRLLSSISPEKAAYRYAADKWSVAEVVGHIADTERVMSYRLLRVARGDRTPLPGFDQDVFVRNADFGACTPERLAEDYEAVRGATLSLLKGLQEAALARRGVVSDRETTAAALAYVIAGHERHHLNILKDKYL